MRVISGTARNKPLLSVEGMDTRPTIDRVKEGVYSSIQFIVPGARVLDLFSGTGQMGIEALSRGASFGVFVDQAPKAVDVTTRNLKSCGLFDKARVVNMVSQDFLRTTKEKFDIVFLDPPYKSDFYQKACDLLLENNLLSSESLVICEHEAKQPLSLENFELLTTKKYGIKALSYYALKQG